MHASDRWADNKKRFKECVLEVWQTRLIGKQYVKMQNEINTQDENLNDILLAYDGGYVEKLNKSRKRQIKKNIYVRSRRPTLPIFAGDDIPAPEQ